MGLFDVIDEITEKQVMKTDTGDNRIFGVMTGIVAKNYDKDMPGRICVTIPVRDQGANELQWARLAMPSSGTRWGHYFLPEVGDQVLLVFEQGNIEKPYVIGCIPKDSNKFLKNAVDPNNQYKKIVTKHGNSIIFEDNQAGDGDNDKIKILTANGGHMVLMDNQNKKISITDKEGKNKIVMKTEMGHMEIQAEKKLTIKVGDAVTLTLNGNSGGVQLECSKFTVKARDNINMESNGVAKLAGSNVTLDASSMLKAKSSGAAIVEGNPIKIG